MLHEFLHANRAHLIEMCSAKAAGRSPAAPSGIGSGIPLLMAQLIEILRQERTPAALARHASEPHGRPSLVVVPRDIASSASMHGAEMRRSGLDIDQVVHGYGDLCQSVTELAMELDAPISVDEFHTFNRCLDDAIADAVTAFCLRRDTDARRDSPDAEMRSLVDAAIMSFAVIRAGQVSLMGTTAAIHEDCLVRLRELLIGTTTEAQRAAPR